MQTKSSTYFQFSDFQTNHSTDGDLMIDEADREGKFVRLENHGNDDVSIGSWILKYIAGDKEVTFKFSSRQVVKAGKSLTVNLFMQISDQQCITKTSENTPRTSGHFRFGLTTLDKNMGFQ